MPSAPSTRGSLVALILVGALLVSGLVSRPLLAETRREAEARLAALTQLAEKAEGDEARRRWRAVLEGFVGLYRQSRLAADLDRAREAFDRASGPAQATDTAEAARARVVWGLALLELGPSSARREAVAMLRRAAPLAGGSDAERAARAVRLLAPIVEGVTRAQAVEEALLTARKGSDPGDSGPPASLAALTKLERFGGGLGAQVVISLDRPALFGVAELRGQGGRRLAITLRGVQRKPEVPAEHGGIGPVGAIRVEPLPQVGTEPRHDLRVVLELGAGSGTRVFPLADPFRIVVEVLSPLGLRAGRTWKPGPVRRVAIDAGHGGVENGAVGPAGTREKEVALDVATRLAATLQRLGLAVVMVRKGDETVTLQERVARAAAARANLLVSIHANATVDGKATGLETFFGADERLPTVAGRGDPKPRSDRAIQALAARENQGSVGSGAAMTAVTDDALALRRSHASAELASEIQEAMVGKLRLPDRGVRRAQFYVLLASSMPSALVELGFISNPKEEARLADPRFRQRAAEALAAGIARYADRQPRPRRQENARGKR